MQKTVYGCIYCGKEVERKEIIVFNYMTQCPECYRDDAFRVTIITGGEEE